jgi:hypothetical protein
MRTSALLSSVLVSSSLLAAACGGENDEPLTRDEAEEAVASVNLSASAQSLTHDVIEISTHFTIGQGIREAALELKLFAESQIPCATVSADANEGEGHVSIDFGDLNDACSFRGRNYAGLVVLDIERSEGQVAVHHSWQGLTNGHVTVDGEADVSWSRDDASRHVVYDIEFTHEDHDGTLRASGDVTQRVIDSVLGLTAGVEIDGTRTWSAGDRSWSLDIEGVQVRGLDPVPQAGTYALVTPNDKHVTLSFERLSPTTIRVTLTGPKGRTHQVDVLSIQ